VPAPIFVASADQLDAPTAAAAESDVLFFFFVPDEAPSPRVSGSAGDVPPSADPARAFFFFAIARPRRRGETDA
jgi:hypothetical protein